MSKPIRIENRRGLGQVRYYRAQGWGGPYRWICQAGEATGLPSLAAARRVVRAFAKEVSAVTQHRKGTP